MAKIKITTVISPHYTHLEAFINTLAREGVPADAKEIYRARNAVYSLQRQGIDLCIKAFRKPSFPNNYIYTTARHSKARRSFDNTRRLLQMGFDAPQPVAYIECCDGARLLQSYYVNVMLPTAHNVRHWEQRDDADELVSDLALYMSRLHSAGIYHKDFSPGNILVTKSAEDGSRRFNLIDVNRMRFNVHDKATLMHNFKAINLDAAQTARLARAYARHSGTEPAETERKALAELSHYLRSKARHKHLKTLFKRTSATSGK